MIPTDMERLSEQMDRFSEQIMELELTIVDRFTPALERTADSMHVFWFVTQPWYGRLWHLLTGHRKRGYCLTHPFHEARP